MEGCGGEEGCRGGCEWEGAASVMFCSVSKTFTEFKLPTELYFKAKVSDCRSVCY